MNRTDRLLAIVLELQAKGWQRAEDLALRFEISKRTVYRDMQALAESGVPVVSSPGQGYSLVEGYFLPPLSFTADEALILLLGGGFVAETFDAEYQAAAYSAIRKIEAVLTDTLRADVNYLMRSLRFIALSPPGDVETLRQVRRAIIQRHVLRFCYVARQNEAVGGVETVRDVDPYALVNVHNTWYLTAYCHLRHDIRNFRIDRMAEVEVLRRAFMRPDAFNIQDHTPEPLTLTVRALFDREVGRWVREETPFYLVSMLETQDGWLVTLNVRREDDIFRWLLGWGAHVRVLEPASLRERLVAAAQEVIDKNQKD